MNALLSAYAQNNNNNSSDDESDTKITLSHTDTAHAQTQSTQYTTAPPTIANQPTVHYLSSSSSTHVINANLRADRLFTPAVTVPHPLARDNASAVNSSTTGVSITGTVEAHHMDETVFAAEFERGRQKSLPSSKKAQKRSRGNVSNTWWGSWAPPQEEEVEEVDQAGAVDEVAAAEIDARLEARKKARMEAAHSAAEAAGKAAERSVFHGRALADYQGRTYLWPPTAYKADADKRCYLPKKLLHTYAGHSKAVNRVRLFPKYGHIMLSASMDSTVKLWDLRPDEPRQCLRTMYGHSQAVREVVFEPNHGRSFLSAGYDKVVRVWDTETGQCTARLSNQVMAYCAQFYPLDENLVLAGAADHRIYQWDVRANAVVQTYNEHEGAVNTLTFYDNSRRFMSTSDDKKIFLWEFGIPVVIKHISDPEMHAVPAVAMHPDGTTVACQNLNNTISVYEVGEADGKMRRKNKTFKGHVVAGYACDLTFSPDGQYLVSGDGNGSCFFWDFKKTTLYSKIKCHDGVAISCQWHPMEPSQLVTAGWDGKIQLWA